MEFFQRTANSVGVWWWSILIGHHFQGQYFLTVWWPAGGLFIAHQFQGQYFLTVWWPAGGLY